jgi:hypothetical protein
MLSSCKQEGPFLTKYIIGTLAAHKGFGYSGVKVTVPGANKRPRGALLVVLAAVPSFCHVRFR